MTKKEFLKRVSNGKLDVLQVFINLLAKGKIEYCVIGGLAVNAYAEPVVSLDLDVVVAAENLDALFSLVESVFKFERFAHSINLSSSQSDLRIQIQMDKRYQPFVSLAVERDVLGYRMDVARIEDVLQGKIWAWSDESRRKSKRHKDLADIARLVEVRPDLLPLLPEAINEMMG
ncbi:MAG: nucleotidyl transferase AbiEii/AbiGii toxin family protein [Candidatus Aminicenantes bacterium]|nr:nucleotidyl transferase AbiEii/AbiGii toxin family protein [Candidatus Aminicenantes bacterium]